LIYLLADYELYIWPIILLFFGLWIKVAAVFSDKSRR
jgi:hypothetical protein